MSTSPPPAGTDTSQRECPHCGYTGPDAHTYRAYCTPECYYQARGQSVLEHLERDHRFCATCWAQIKEVEPATETTPDAFIGFQFPKPSAREGLKTLPSPEDHVDRSRVALICECGNTDHQHHEREYRVLDDLQARLRNLLQALHTLAAEDKLDHEPDHEVFLENVTYEEDRVRYAEAVGRCLYDDHNPDA